MIGLELGIMLLKWIKLLFDEGLDVDKQNNYVLYLIFFSMGWIIYIVMFKQLVFGLIYLVQSMLILLIIVLMLVFFVYIFLIICNLLFLICKFCSQIWCINYSNMNLKVDERLKNNDLLLLNEVFQDLMEWLQ